MNKYKKISLVLLILFSLPLSAENNLTKKQIDNARILLKEYAFMRCLGEGFNRKQYESNNANKLSHKKPNDNNSTNKVVHKKNLYRYDLITSIMALHNSNVYYIEDNTKHTTAKNLAVYRKISQFVKKNYLKVQRLNTPFIMQHVQNKRHTVYLTCFDLYHSKELNNLIKAQDKYINNNSILDDIIVINNEKNITK